VLHVRRPDEKEPDGAVWNFPLGWKGQVMLRIMLQKGCGGAEVALADRLFDPCDDEGQRLAVFRLPLGASRPQATVAKLQTGRWHDLCLAWDLDNQRCDVRLNNKPVKSLPQSHPTGNGLHYLRLRSTSQQVDPNGFLIERVAAHIEDPIAPPRSVAENRRLQQYYIKHHGGLTPQP